MTRMPTFDLYDDSKYIRQYPGPADIAFTSGTEGPGSNAASVHLRVFYEVMSMLLCNMHCLCVEKDK
jgi:hypothetical protein